MSNVNDELAELLAEMKAYGEANHVPIININGLAVLEKAVAAKKPQRVLEIGTGIGYSTLYIAANAAPEVEIVSLELSEERAAEARAFVDRSPYGQQIRIITGDAGENIQKLTGSFDMVFIDAAKGQAVDQLAKKHCHGLILPFFAAEDPPFGMHFFTKKAETAEQNLFRRSPQWVFYF